MPTFGRTDGGKWHIVGPDGCRYGKAFADDSDTASDETVTATDIVSYEPSDAPARDQSRSGTVGISRHGLRTNRERQRLVLPSEISDTEPGLCTSCRAQLETHQKHRARLIPGLKQMTPLRDIEWTTTEFDSLQVCYWCHVHEATVWASDRLDSRVCPACGRLYNSPFGDPGRDNTPKKDRRPPTPTEFVTPIVFGTTVPDYDPADLTGSNRPIIEMREKTKYAKLKCDLERTGHAFTPAAIDALRAVRDAYAEEVADDTSHQTDVSVDVGMTAQSVTVKGVYPSDVAAVIGDCWDTVGNPANWFRVGWLQQEQLYGRPLERSIPGDKPVIDAFPRLQTQSPAASVHTDVLEQVTETGRYQRGKRYYNRGAVTEIERVDDRLQATVQGSQQYKVRATVDDGRYVTGQCNCPDDAVPCKHIVAAVLASGDVERVGGDHPIEDLVANATRNELETLLLDAAEDDLSLRKQIYNELQN